MNSFKFLGYTLNWLEFVTYIIIPSTIIIMILLYFLFNYKNIVKAMDCEDNYLNELDI